MLLRSTRHAAQLALLLSVLLSGLPAPRISAQATQDADDTPQPAFLTVPPVLLAPDAHLPALALDIAIAPDPLAVGDTAAITLTVSNGAPDPAEDLVVTLPTPDGTSALPGPNTLGAAQGWLWNLGHLDGSSSLTLTASLRLERMPQGAALLLHPQASARGLSLPTTTTGGVLVLPADRSPATLAFTPGATTRLRSRDGRVAIGFPGRGFPRRLTLRAGITPPAGALLPPAGHARPGTLFLDATDDAGQAVHQFD